MMHQSQQNSNQLVSSDETSIKTSITGPTDQLLEQVIQAIKSPRFVPGYLANERLRETFTSGINPVLNLRIRDPNRTFLQYKDDYYPTWNANRIEGTHFSAGQGPQDAESFSDFLTNTAFNKDLPIRHIIALGSTLAYYSSTYQDFYDYCIKEREEVFGKYRVQFAPAF